MKQRILAVGRIEVELAMYFPYLPSSGRTVRGEEITRFPGGSGLNTAVALSKLGAEATLSGRIGKDPNGDRVLRFLERQSVDRCYVGKDSSLPTGNLARLLENGGRFRNIRFEGAGAKLSTDDVEFAFNYGPDGAIICADIPDDALLAAVYCGEKDDIPMLLDASMERDTPLPLKDLWPVEIFVIDGDTAGRMTGEDPSTIEKCLTCCMSLAGMIRSHYYLLKLGNRGNFLYDGMYHHFIPAVEGENNGCFAAPRYYTAALFTKFLTSGDIKQAVKVAAAAEAAAKARVGGAAELPEAQDLKRFLREQGEPT